MKITVTYGNKATIPTGVPYENLTPLYSMTAELEVDATIAKETSDGLFNMIKRNVDERIFKDMKEFKNYKVKCTCSPLWLAKESRLQHDKNCPKVSTKDK